MTAQDYEVIGQALQAAINAETDDHVLRSYRQVLKKLHADTLRQRERRNGASLMEDGFRYDYDDASDLH